MKNVFLSIPLIIFLCNLQVILAQNPSSSIPSSSDALPYYEIPPYPESYSAANVAARVVDGLGYRFYWATEGLQLEDLAFRPSEKGRTTLETIEHIMGLTNALLKTVKNEPIISSDDQEEYDYVQLRKKTLYNIKEASEILKNSSEEDIEDFKTIFKNGDNTFEYPFWNMLNGPLADAIYHTGQIVSFRRSSGNPINPNVNVFTGKNRSN